MLCNGVLLHLYHTVQGCATPVISTVQGCATPVISRQYKGISLLLSQDSTREYHSCYLKTVQGYFTPVISRQYKGVSLLLSLRYCKGISLLLLQDSIIISRQYKSISLLLSQTVKAYITPVIADSARVYQTCVLL